MFSGFFDIIFFAGFAAFIGYRLYTVLGRKDFEPDEKPQDNVVKFPDSLKEQAVDVPFEEVKDDFEEVKKEYGAQIANKVKKIREYDPSFSIKPFLDGAKYAFEIILKAFSKADEEALKPLLGKDIYKAFIAEINKRKKSDKVEETTLVAVVAANIKNIVLNKKYAKIAVEIVSEQISLVKDKKGKVIDGDPSHVEEISEVWTFSRNLSSSNPNWELVETGSAG